MDRHLPSKAYRPHKRSSWAQRTCRSRKRSKPRTNLEFNTNVQPLVHRSLKPLSVPGYFLPTPEETIRVTETLSAPLPIDQGLETLLWTSIRQQISISGLYIIDLTLRVIWLNLPNQCQLTKYDFLVCSRRNFLDLLVQASLYCLLHFLATETGPYSDSATNSREAVKVESNRLVALLPKTNMGDLTRPKLIIIRHRPPYIHSHISHRGARLLTYIP